MNMVDLILTVCALAHPTLCHDQHLLLQSHGSLRTCMMEAEPYMAQWAGEHPKVRITRWRCDWPQQEKQNL